MCLSKGFSSGSHLFCPSDCFDGFYNSRCSFLATLSVILVFRPILAVQTDSPLLSLQEHISEIYIHCRSKHLNRKAIMQTLPPGELYHLVIYPCFLLCLPFSVISSWKACVACLLVQHDLLIQQFHLQL